MSISSPRYSPNHSRENSQSRSRENSLSRLHDHSPHPSAAGSPSPSNLSGYDRDSSLKIVDSSEKYIADLIESNNPIYKPLKAIEVRLNCLENRDLTIPDNVRLDLEELSKLKYRVDELFETHFDDSLIQIQTDFDDRCNALRNRYVRVLAPKRPSSKHESGPPVKLPSIDVPKFHGEIAKWASFKNAFLNLIADPRVVYNDGLKSQFLHQALHGEAKEMVENLRECAFEDSWSVLVNHYDDPFRRAKTHYQELSKPKQDQTSLRQRLVGYRQHTSGLTLACAELEIDPFEFTVISNFMDDPRTHGTVRHNWERRVTENPKCCNLPEFLKYVEREAISSERAFRQRSEQKNQRFKQKGHQSEHSAEVRKFGNQPKKGSGHTLTNTETTPPAPRFSGASRVKIPCPVCAGPHYLNRCEEFKAKPVEDRIKLVSDKKICQICFNATCKGVTAPVQCPMKMLHCYKCKKLHHSLLHRSGKPLEINYSTPLEVTSNQNCVLKNSNLCLFNNLVTHVNNNQYPLLATALVGIKNSVDHCRCFLDNGSQFNFITRHLVEKLGLKNTKAQVSVSGIQGQASMANSYTKITITSRCNETEFEIKCVVVENIVSSAIPAEYYDVASWNLPAHLYLADPYFNVPKDIDILLGLDIFWRVLQNGTYHLGGNLPYLKETELGWIVAGSIQTTNSAEGEMVFFIQLSNNELLEQMKKFWHIEHHISNLPLTPDELACEAMFVKSIYRQEDGRFVVSLPFKKDPSLLGDSRFEALKQFMHLENRLQRNPQMRKKYIDCMQEYIDLGHMVEITEKKDQGISYYLPHHPVINPTSTSTSQRTVFNASMKTSSGLSLNEILHTGADDIQPDLISTLMRYRIPLYVATADIVKMFRQIKMHPSHTRFQRVFWRPSPNDILRVYELLVLTFGEKSAPYLAKRCLKELALNHGKNFPRAVGVILKDLFMDNMFTGSDSKEELKDILGEVISLLSSAGFPLSKYASNSPEVLKNIDPSQIENCSKIGFDDKEMVKALGMYWVPRDDTLRIWFDRPNVVDSCTKRQILGVIASIFDPMGLVGPITVRAKCFMQEIWRTTVENVASTPPDAKNLPCQKKSRNIHWDENVPGRILKPWREFSEQLHLLNQISIPRHIAIKNSSRIFELHGFSDASTRAYGAVLYLRTITPNEVQVHLLCSKSRVAPLKQLSISRLELLAATLLAEMSGKVSEILTMNIEISCIRLWCDSKIALSWISSQSYNWNVFVAHRVSTIQTLTKNCQWDYIESSANPADILSRGTDPQELIARQQEWFFGPSWLKKSNDVWPEKIEFCPDPNTREERKVARGATMAAMPFKSTLFEIVSLPDTGKNSTKLVYNQGYNKLLRITAFMSRIFRNRLPYFPRPIRSYANVLFIHDLEYAKMVLLKLSQLETFGNEIRCLKAGKPIASDSRILSLKPFLDIDGVLRVGGRLEHAEMSYEQRHPALLHPTNRLTTLIVMHEHLTNLHAGPKHLKSILRRQFWILYANSCITRCLKGCHTCVIHAAKTQSEVMANLPKERICPSKPFTHTGVDYAGPFQLMQAGGRSRVQIKAYIAVFVCFATKAIHLEAVYDLTTEKFIEALIRFISRRGIPAHIYSDNGTTFVGAQRKINELYALVENNAEFVNKFATDRGFQWHFIPPRAPHFGGIWEAGVKSVKNHLHKTIESYTLKTDQFSTLLHQIEAVLNSRPLTPESSSPDEVNALTPGHFLIGGPLTALPTIDYTNIPSNRLKHWEQVSKMTQLFWQRWRVEYLHTLQQRYKWKDEDKNRGLNINDLVVIKDDNEKPMQWSYGRVHELHPGNDGKSRVVVLRTSKGTVTRPIVKLIKLPIKEI